MTDNAFSPTPFLRLVSMTAENAASVSVEEVSRFSAMADQWWNPDGAFRALHDLGPLRMQYVCEQIMRQSTKNRHILKDLAILDVGCGGGLLAEPLTARGARVVGIDASAEAIEIAKIHASQTGVVIDYRQETAEGLAKTDAQFDVITAFEIIEHVADLKSFLTALSKLLKPEGLLIIATMNRTKRSFLLGVVMAEYVLGWVPAGTHDWDKFVRPSEMVNFWQNLGIAACDVTGVTYKPLARSFQFSKGNAAVNYFMTGKKAKTAF